MTCPKCGNVQLLSMVCTRCGAAMDAGPSPSPVLQPGFDPGPYLGTGEILGKTFSLYFKDLPLFLGLTIVAFSPLLLLFITLLLVATKDLGGVSVEAVTFLGLVLPLFCGPLTIALVVDGVFRRLRGEEASLGDCLRTGLSSLFPVLVVTVLYAVRVLIGFVLCLIPGLIFMTMYSLAVPALLIERVGPFSAMTRSAHLTDGYRWPLFGVLFLIGLIDAGLGQLVDLALETSEGGEEAVYLLIPILLSLFPAGLSSIASALAYHRLRGIKESFGLAETVSVFD